MGVHPLRRTPSVFLGIDLRGQQRFPIEDALSGRLATPRGLEVQIADLSLGGAGLLVVRAGTLRASRAGLELARGEQPLGECEVELVHTSDPGEGASLVGVRFRGAGEELLRAVCRYLVERHSQGELRLVDPRACTLHRDPQRVRQLLVHLCRRRRELRVFDAAGRPAGRLLPLGVDRARLRGCLTLDAPLSVGVGSACQLATSSFTNLYVLPSRLLGGGEQAVFALPDQLLESARRRLGRAPAAPERPVGLELLHPLLPGKVVRKLAREVGLGGLSFDLDVEEDLLVCGSVLDAALLRLADGRALPCRCVVRHTDELPGGGHRCGVEIREWAPGARERWVEEVLARMNPEVEEATPFTLEDAWDVFDRSGYLEEKPPEQIRAMREPFLSTWRRLLRTRTSARFWLHRSRGVATGTVCTTRVYGSTWLVHHMAVDRALPAARKLAVLADLVPRSAFQWLAASHPEGNLVAYFNAEKSFNQSVWVDQLKACEGELEQDVRRVCAWEFRPAQLPALPPALQVRVAGDDDLALIAADLEERDGAFPCRACDLTPERLRVRELGADGSGAVGRERQVFVAGAPGRVRGYALLEHASPGVNIFSLYDTCRLVVLPSARRAEAVAAALFETAVVYFREIGVESFLCLAGEKDAAPPTAHAAFRVELIRAMAPSSVLARWVAYLNELWAQR